MSPRRRRRAADLPPDPDDWTVADEDDAHLTRVEGPSALSSGLRRLTRRPGWGERLGAARVEAAWPAIVGDALVEHCQPVRLAGRVLVVRAVSPAWATQLRYLTAQLTERAEAVLGAGSVARVEVVVGPLDGRAGRSDLGHTGAPDEEGGP